MPNVKIDPNDIAIRLKGLKKSFGPQDVLCDVNLDIRRGETMVIIGKSGGGKSVILKHHDMVSAFKVADRIAMLYNGRIIEVGTVDEIKNTSNPYVHQFITGQRKISVEEGEA